MFNKIVLTMLYIAVYLFQQTVIISSVWGFKDYTLGLSLEIAWGFWDHALPPCSLEEHILVHWLSILVWLCKGYNVTRLQSV